MRVAILPLCPDGGVCRDEFLEQTRLGEGGRAEVIVIGKELVLHICYLELLGHELLCLHTHGCVAEDAHEDRTKTRLARFAITNDEECFARRRGGDETIAHDFLYRGDVLGGEYVVEPLVKQRGRLLGGDVVYRESVGRVLLLTETEHPLTLADVEVAIGERDHTLVYGEFIHRIHILECLEDGVGGGVNLTTPSRVSKGVCDVSADGLVGDRTIGVVENSVAVDTVIDFCEYIHKFLVIELGIAVLILGDDAVCIDVGVIVGAILDSDTLCVGRGHFSKVFGFSVDADPLLKGSRRRVFGCIG